MRTLLYFFFHSSINSLLILEVENKWVDKINGKLKVVFLCGIPDRHKITFHNSCIMGKLMQQQ